MTLSFILDSIPRWMNDYGHGADYEVVFRDLLVPASGTLVFEGGRTYCYYVWENTVMAPSVTVESENGITDFTSGTHTQVYLHQGKIKLTNPDGYAKIMLLIQVVPRIGKPATSHHSKASKE